LNPANLLRILFSAPYVNPKLHCAQKTSLKKPGKSNPTTLIQEYAALRPSLPLCFVSFWILKIGKTPAETPPREGFAI
jgi:hypothetical protein